jgi:hypothetical protein
VFVLFWAGNASREIGHVRKEFDNE